MNVKKIDKRKWKPCYQDEAIDAYELIVWCVETGSKSSIHAIQRDQQICYFVEYRHGVGRSKSDSVLPATVPNRIPDPGCQTIHRIRSVPGTG